MQGAVSDYQLATELFICHRAALPFHCLHPPSLPAELLGPNNTATSRLTIDIYPPDASFPEGPGWGASRSVHSGNHSVPSSGGGSDSAARGTAGEESRRFALNWRIPG